MFLTVTREKYGVQLFSLKNKTTTKKQQNNKKAHFYFYVCIRYVFRVNIAFLQIFLSFFPHHFNLMHFISTLSLGHLEPEGTIFAWMAQGWGGGNLEGLPWGSCPVKWPCGAFEQWQCWDRSRVQNVKELTGGSQFLPLAEVVPDDVRQANLKSDSFTSDFCSYL